MRSLDTPRSTTSILSVNEYTRTFFARQFDYHQRLRSHDDFSILKPYFLNIRSNVTLFVTERIPDLFSVLASKPGIRIWKYSYDMSKIISMRFNFRVILRFMVCIFYVFYVFKYNNYQFNDFFF